VTGSPLENQKEIPLRGGDFDSGREGENIHDDNDIIMVSC
jgi:hypothetical protein